MGNLDTSRRLKIILDLVSLNEDLKEPLELEGDILRVQQKIEATPLLGALSGALGPESIGRLQKESLRIKKPMSSLMEPSTFNAEALSAPFIEVVSVLASRRIGNSKAGQLLNSMSSQGIGLGKLIEAVLREDEPLLVEYGERLKVEPSVLVYAVSSILRPFFEEVARRVDSSHYETWWEHQCPICGRTPTLGIVRDRKRYLYCTYCGAEYPSDTALCVHCGNRDPSSLKFLSSNRDPKNRIDFCTICSGYLKVLDETASNAIPKDLLDILTLELDQVATSKGLKRN